jgi:hypothetical protein
MIDFTKIGSIWNDCYRGMASGDIIFLGDFWEEEKEFLNALHISKVARNVPEVASNMLQVARNVPEVARDYSNTCAQYPRSCAQYPKSCARLP